MDDDDRILSDLHDPEWAKRVADIEKEFLKVDRRRRSPTSLTTPARARRRLRPAYIWFVIVLAVVAYAALAKPWGVQQVPVYDQPVVSQVDGPTTAATEPVDASLGEPTR